MSESKQLQRLLSQGWIPVTVTFRNGDQLTGAITVEQFQLTTLLGITTVPLKHIKRIEVKGLVTVQSQVPAKPAAETPPDDKAGSMSKLLEAKRKARRKKKD